MWIFVCVCVCEDNTNLYRTDPNEIEIKCVTVSNELYSAIWKWVVGQHILSQWRLIGFQWNCTTSLHRPKFWNWYIPTKMRCIRMNCVETIDDIRPIDKCLPDKLYNKNMNTNPTRCIYHEPTVVCLLFVFCFHFIVRWGEGAEALLYLFLFVHDVCIEWMRYIASFIPKYAHPMIINTDWIWHVSMAYSRNIILFAQHVWTHFHPDGVNSYEY